MGGLMKTPNIPPAPPPPEAPKPVRMPNSTDRRVTQAVERDRQAVMRRQGRLSTILTDQTSDTTQKLGS